MWNYFSTILEIIVGNLRGRAWKYILAEILTAIISFISYHQSMVVELAEHEKKKLTKNKN